MSKTNQFCKQCGGAFWARHHLSTLCSDDCRKAAKAAARAKYRTRCHEENLSIGKICSECGERFWHNNLIRNLCSEKCRNARREKTRRDYESNPKNKETIRKRVLKAYHEDGGMEKQKTQEAKAKRAVYNAEYVNRPDVLARKWKSRRQSIMNRRASMLRARRKNQGKLT